MRCSYCNFIIREHLEHKALFTSKGYVACFSCQVVAWIRSGHNLINLRQDLENEKTLEKYKPIPHFRPD